MSKHKKIQEETELVDEKMPKLVDEDVDDSKQSIEVAAYYLGMERNQYSQPGDELNDWLQAEKAVKENID